MIRRLFVTATLFCGLVVDVAAQTGGGVDMVKKNVSDTILQNRTLLLAGTFDAQKAMLQLFPGKYYSRSYGKEGKDELVNWECKTCQSKVYPDANQEEVEAFPFRDGVATRVINVMDFKDSSGMQYKVVAFNHSVFDAEGLQVSRFTGGLLGLAKFVLTDQGWKLRMYQPAIASYGAFAQCPTPRPLLIGKDQYAFVLPHSNGPGGGPFTKDYYLVAGINGGYQQIMAAYGVAKTQVDPEEQESSWTSEYRVDPSNKTYFRDIIITLKGTINAADTDALPSQIKAVLKGRKTAAFVAEERYVYRAGKGYELKELRIGNVE